MMLKCIATGRQCCGMSKLSFYDYEILRTWMHGCSYHHFLLKKQPSSQQARTNNCFLTPWQPCPPNRCSRFKDNPAILLMFYCQISMILNCLCNVPLNQLQVKDLWHKEAWSSTHTYSTQHISKPTVVLVCMFFRILVSLTSLQD